MGSFFSALSLDQGGVSVLSTGLVLHSEGDPSTGASLDFLHLVSPSGPAERRLCSVDSKPQGSRSGWDPRQDPVEWRLEAIRKLSVRLRLCSAASRSRFSYERTCHNIYIFFYKTAN